MKMEAMGRNCNIDRLRILSMLMVVILHVTGFGFLNYDSIQEKRGTHQTEQLGETEMVFSRLFPQRRGSFPDLCSLPRHSGQSA